MAKRITKIKEKQEDGSFVEYPVGVRSENVYVENDNENLDSKLQEIQEGLNKIYWIKK